MELTEWERFFLKYYLNNYNAKWMRVFYNKHPFLDTKVELFTIYKRKLKHQPLTGSETYTNMFKQLEERKLYFIPNLLNQEKKEDI